MVENSPQPSVGETFGKKVWYGIGRAAESLGPKAWENRILKIVDEKITPKLTPEQQAVMVKIHPIIETGAKVWGWSIAATEVAAVAASGVIIGKKIQGVIEHIVSNKKHNTWGRKSEIRVSKGSDKWVGGAVVGVAALKARDVLKQKGSHASQSPEEPHDKTSWRDPALVQTLQDAGALHGHKRKTYDLARLLDYVDEAKKSDPLVEKLLMHLRLSKDYQDASSVRGAATALLAQLGRLDPVIAGRNDMQDLARYWTETLGAAGSEILQRQVDPAVRRRYTIGMIRDALHPKHALEVIFAKLAGISSEDKSLIAKIQRVGVDRSIQGKDDVHGKLVPSIELFDLLRGAYRNLLNTRTPQEQHLWNKIRNARGVTYEHTLTPEEEKALWKLASWMVNHRPDHFLAPLQAKFNAEEIENKRTERKLAKVKNRSQQESSGMDDVPKNVPDTKTSKPPNRLKAQILEQYPEPLTSTTPKIPDKPSFITKMLETRKKALKSEREAANMPVNNKLVPNIRAWWKARKNRGLDTSSRSEK